MMFMLMTCDPHQLERGSDGLTRCRRCECIVLDAGHDKPIFTEDKLREVVQHIWEHDI